MSSSSQHSSSHAEAVSVAWKFFLRGYASEDAAIRALRRRCRGLSTQDASSHLQQASTVLKKAIQVLKLQVETLHAIYKASGRITPEDLAPFEPELAARFPDYPLDAVRAALQSAMILHMR